MATMATRRKKWPSESSAGRRATVRPHYYAKAGYAATLYDCTMAVAPMRLER